MGHVPISQSRNRGHSRQPVRFLHGFGMHSDGNRATTSLLWRSPDPNMDVPKFTIPHCTSPSVGCDDAEQFALLLAEMALGVYTEQLPAPLPDGDLAQAPKRQKLQQSYRRRFALPRSFERLWLQACVCA